MNEVQATESQVTPLAQATAGSPAVQAATDANKVAEVKASEQDPDFASKFAALTRKQKDIYIREKRLKEMEQKYAGYDELERLKSENPYEYFKKSGLDLNSVVQGAVKDGEPPSTEDKVAALEKKIADYEKGLELERQQKIAMEQQKQIDTFKNSIKDKLTADADRYELINLDGAYGKVYEVIENHFSKTLGETGEGEVLETEAAAEIVEKELEERATKFLKAKKLSGKSEPLEVPEPKIEGNDAYDYSPGIKRRTMSAALTATTSAPAPLYESPEAAKERIAREFNAKLRNNNRV